MTTYSIGYSWARELRRRILTDEERGAVERLADDCGTEGDVRTLAAMLASRGLDGAAADLLRILPPPAVLTREMVEDALAALDTPPGGG